MCERNSTKKQKTKISLSEQKKAFKLITENDDRQSDT
jgi:hypothetical protein